MLEDAVDVLSLEDVVLMMGTESVVSLFRAGFCFGGTEH